MNAGYESSKKHQAFHHDSAQTNSCGDRRQHRCCASTKESFHWQDTQGLPALCHAEREEDHGNSLYPRLLSMKLKSCTRLPRKTRPPPLIKCQPQSVSVRAKTRRAGSTSATRTKIRVGKKVLAYVGSRRTRAQPANPGS